MTKIILMLGLAALSSPAAELYDNTVNDQQFSVFYSTGYNEIGDQVEMISPGDVTSLDAQFFNDGSDATFDAQLQFYQVGSPVGAQIGGPFTVTGIFIASFTSQTVTFPDPGDLPLPQDVIATLTVQNVSAGGDIGVNFFDPPTVGTSDDTFYIADSGMGLQQVSTNMDIDNIYFEIDGTATAPEPAAITLTLGGLLILAVSRRRRT